MTAEGGWLSDIAVNPRRSAYSSAVWMVSPMSRRKGPASTRGAAPAEIGVERRRQRGARRERGKRRRGKTRDLAQRIGFTFSEWAGPGPTEQRPVQPPPDCVLMRGAGRKSSEPTPAGIAGPALGAGGRGSFRREPKGLDHFPALGSPEPKCAGQSADAARRASARRPRAAGHRRPDARRLRPAAGQGRSPRRPHRRARKASRKAAWTNHAVLRPCLSRVIHGGRALALPSAKPTGGCRVTRCPSLGQDRRRDFGRRRPPPACQGSAPSPRRG